MFVSGISSIVSLVVGCLGLNWHLACSVDKTAENSRKRVSVTIESWFVTAKQWITGRMRCRLCEFLRVPASSSKSTYIYARKRISVTIESRFVTAKQWITGRMRCRLCEFLRVPANQRTFMRASQALTRHLFMRARMRNWMRRMLQKNMDAYFFGLLL